MFFPFQRRHYGTLSRRLRTRLPVFLLVCVYLCTRPTISFGISTTNPVAPNPIASHEIELLDFIKPEDDLLERSQSWTFAQKNLISSVDTRAVLEIPYRPTQEYDFTIEFTRIRGNDGVIQMVSAAGTSFSWVMDGYIHTFGFENVRGAHANGVPSSVRAAGLVKGRTYISTVQVRKNGVRALLDGRLIVEIVSDYGNFSSNATRRDPLRLALRTWDSETVFHRIKVTEISGIGTVIGSSSNGNAAPNAVSPGKGGQDASDSRPSIILDASKITDIQIDNYRLSARAADCCVVVIRTGAGP